MIFRAWWNIGSLIQHHNSHILARQTFNIMFHCLFSSRNSVDSKNKMPKILGHPQPWHLGKAASSKLWRTGRIHFTVFGKWLQWLGHSNDFYRVNLVIFPCQVSLLSLAFLFLLRKKIGKMTFSHNSHHLVHVGLVELHLDLHHLLKATRGISLPAKKEQCWKVKKQLEIQVRKFNPTKLMMLNPCIFFFKFILAPKFTVENLAILVEPRWDLWTAQLVGQKRKAHELQGCIAALFKVGTSMYILYVYICVYTFLISYTYIYVHTHEYIMIYHHCLSLIELAFYTPRHLYCQFDIACCMPHDVLSEPYLPIRITGLHQRKIISEKPYNDAVTRNLKITQIWDQENHLKPNLHDFGFQPLVFHGVWSDDGRSPASSSRSPCSRVMWSAFRRPTSASHRRCRILKEPLTEGRSRVSPHSWLRLLRKNVQGSRLCVKFFLAYRNFQHPLAGWNL